MKLSVTINKCQVRYLEMLGTYPIAGIHETVSYYQQMSGTIPRNVRYISYSRYTRNCQLLSTNVRYDT